jgi:hypothetical protein
MTKLQAWKNIILALIFVGEPILFVLKIFVSVPLLLLKQTWPIQAAIGFCLALIGITKSQVWKAIVIAFVLVGETFLFTSNDPAFAPILILLMLTFPIQVFIGFYPLLLEPKISTWSMPRRIITIGAAILYCLGISIFLTPLLWGAEQLRNTAQLGENRYYFTTRTKMSGPGCDFYCNFTIPTLYKCDSIGLECETIFQDDYIDIVESGLVVDKDANEIQLFLSYSEMPHGGFNSKYGVAYVYGKQPRFVISSAEFSDSRYYLTIPHYVTTPLYYTTPQGDTPLTYQLYKCNQDSANCKRLPFEYVTKITDNVEMEITDIGELKIDNGVLIYAYDTHNSQSVCYVADCTLKGE